MTTLERIKPVLDKYGYSARENARGAGLDIYNHKRELAGAISATGEITRRMDGKRALMGALVRDDLKAVLL